MARFGLFFFVMVCLNYNVYSQSSTAISVGNRTYEIKQGFTIANGLNGYLNFVKNINKPRNVIKALNDYQAGSLLKDIHLTDIKSYWGFGGGIEVELNQYINYFVGFTVLEVTEYTMYYDETKILSRDGEYSTNPKIKTMASSEIGLIGNITKNFGIEVGYSAGVTNFVKFGVKVKY